MKRLMVVAALSALTVAACGNDSAGDTGTEPVETAAEAEPEGEPAETAAPEPEPDISEPAPEPGVPSDLAITDVVFDDHITITNLGSAPVSVDGLWLCNRPNYVPLPTALIAPGESIDISDLPFPSGGGEAALYLSNNFGDSTQLVDYVAWGAGGGRASVAASAGLWPADDTVAADGTSISAPNGGSSSADWS